MERKYQRREIIKLLGLSGFGLFLPSCNFKGEEEVVENEFEDRKPPLTQEKPRPFDYFNSKNVSYFKKEEPYYAENNIAFNLKIKQNPKIIALCENTNGVSEAVKYANENNLQITVKSGGHSFEGFSSNNDGMQINLSLMNKMEWGSFHELKVQPACLLKDLYDETLPKNRILPAGSCGTVGLGGLALGGGYGFFSRKYGLTCDHLIEAEMVDGKGEIVNTKNDLELLWALKGGGNGNFGIITEMKFKTWEAPKGFTRHRFKAYKLDGQRAKSILEKWFSTSEQLPQHAFSAFVLNGKTLTILVTHYEDINAEIVEMLDALEDLCDKTSKGTMKNLARSLKTYYGVQEPIYFKNSSAGYYKDFSDIENYIDQILEKVINGPGLIYQINTLGGKINDEDFEKESCYPHREFSYLSELQAYWDEGRNAEYLISKFDEIQELFYNNGIRRQYRNYPNLNFRDWENAYWGKSNYAELQNIKLKYDPNNRIHHPQSVKVSKSV